MCTRVLGIDVGTNSVGWALVRLGDDPDVEAMGVRIFHEAVEPKDREPKNSKRRAKRLLRRQIRRRAQRRRAITTICQKHALLPTDPEELHRLQCDYESNPFRLRAEALDRALTLHELGRVMLHLGAHRGYKSNRKALLNRAFSEPEIREAAEELERERKAKAAAGRLRKEEQKEDEEGKVLQAIAALEKEMQEWGSRTLGEHLHRQLMDPGIGRARRTAADTANYTREMVEAEFNAIWESQRRFHPELSDKLKAQLYRAIFFQRPLKIRKRGVEWCPFEGGRKRAFKAQVISQTFRAWQQANSLEWRPSEIGAQWRKLTPEEIRVVAEALLAKAEVKFTEIRKLLKHPKETEYNLAIGGRESLKGAETNVRLRSILGEAWDRMDDLEQDRLVHELVHSDSMDALATRLRKSWGFDPKTVYRLITTDLPSGTASLSAKAMRKLVPEMQRGLRYDEACKKIYDRFGPDIKVNLQAKKVPMPPERANPVVHRALMEVRRIVNAVIERYGKPDAIHVEAARDLKLTKKQRDSLQQHQRRNELANKEAREQFQRLHPGREPSGADLEKYRLWKESNGLCPYTGRSIALEELWTASVDVEHIIPLPRCWDDSFRNKTLCDATENRLRKKNKTPREAYSEEDLERILQRLEGFSSIPRGKKNLFKLEWNEKAEENFTNRQFNDTTLATTLARRMLEPIFGREKVLCLPGKLTAFLRRHWGLETVLGGQEKNREDHRHHAVDAVVIALTSRSLFQRMATFSGRYGSEHLEHSISKVEPIPNLRDRVLSMLEELVVSHQTTRRARGGFVEDTAYGKVAPGQYVYRKPVGSLSDGEIDRVRDLGLRRRLKAIGSKALKDMAKKNPKKPFVYFDRFGRECVVRRVRLLANASDRSMIPIGPAHYASASNHHVAVFDVGGERRYVVASLYEVYQRLRRGEPVYDRSAMPGGRFLFAWHPNDTVVVEGRPEKYYRVVKFSDYDPERHRKVYLLVRPVHRAVETKQKQSPENARENADVLCNSPGTLLLVSGPVSVTALGEVR